MSETGIWKMLHQWLHITQTNKWWQAMSAEFWVNLASSTTELTKHTEPRGYLLQIDRSRTHVRATNNTLQQRRLIICCRWQPMNHTINFDLFARKCQIHVSSHVAVTFGNVARESRSRLSFTASTMSIYYKSCRY